MSTSKPVALVTGATAGIGRAIVDALHGDGYRVIAAARRRDKLEEIRDTLGDDILPLELDVADAGAVMHLTETLPSDWRTLQVLVNNAGLALGREPAQRCTLSDWERMVAVNIGGTIRLVHTFLPGMVARGRGRIINLGSVAARYAYPGGNVYGATKAFVEHFTLNLKADLIGTGVHATTIAPALTGDTEFSVVRFKGDEDRVSKLYEGLAYLTPANVAEAVRWACAQPDHVTINYLEIMPNCQAPAPLVFKRPN